ncbi:MAG: phosphate ABC transporter substrate-binding protein, partial [Akkermansia sp.]
MKFVAKILTIAAVLNSLSMAADQVTVDSSIKPYVPISGVSGNLSAVGSDTLNNLMTLWAEGFSKKYPSVKIGVEGKGSSTAPPALTAGTAQLAPMSRAMKREEIAAFEAKYGYKPTEIKVALDAVAFFVNKNNPIQALSLTQVDSIFSSTFKRGGSNITDWGDAGVPSMKGKAISIYGRNSASGTNGFVKEIALKKGDYKNSVKEQPGSSAVVQGISSDVQGIGYSGIGYVTSGVKTLSIAEKGGQVAVQPSYDNCI